MLKKIGIKVMIFALMTSFLTTISPLVSITESLSEEKTALQVNESGSSDDNDIDPTAEARKIAKAEIDALAAEEAKHISIVNPELSGKGKQYSVAEVKSYIKKATVPLNDFVTNRAVPKLRAAPPINVDTWAKFAAAYNDANVDTIILTTSVESPTSGTTNRLNERTTPLTIIGGGNRITIRYQNFSMLLGNVSVSNACVLTLQDVNLVSTVQDVAVISRSANKNSSSNMTGGANWIISLTDVGTPTGHIGPLADVPEAVLVMTGTKVTDLSYTPSSTNYRYINTKRLLITGENTVLSGYMKSNFWEHGATGAFFQIDDGAQLIITHDSTGSNVFRMEGTGTKATFNILGKKSLKDTKGNTRIQIESTSNLGADSGGVISFNSGASNANGGLEVNIKDYATFSSKSLIGNSTPALMAQGQNVNFYLENHAEFLAETNGSPTDLSATFRYRYSGQSTFNLDTGALFRVKRLGYKSTLSHANDATEAIRFYGVGNNVNVAGGAQFYVENGGTGTPRNGDGGNSRNAVLHFMDNNSATDFSMFNVTGRDSMIKFAADSGPAIDSQGALRFNAEQGSILEAIGRTAGNSATSGGLFNTNNRDFQMTMNNPQYYDFRNNTTGNNATSKNLFTVQDSNAGDTAFFKSQMSAASFYTKGSNLDASPSFSRNELLTYTASTRNFTLSQSPDTNFTTNFGTGFVRYNRVTANNNFPDPQFFVAPTDADKTVYLMATLKEGFDGNGDRIIRPVYDAEAHGVIEVTNPDGSIKNFVGSSQYSTNVYGKTMLGMLNFQTGDFLQKGATIKLTKLWRGTLTNESFPTPADLVNGVPTKTVADVTPPTPLTANAVSNASNQITGKGQAGATVMVKVNGSWLSQTTTVDAVGDWTFALSQPLAKTDIVDVYLKEDADLTTLGTELNTVGLSLPTSYTTDGNGMTGNLTADVGINYTYHDATFQNAIRLPVSDAAPVLTATKSVKLINPYGTVGGTVTYTGDTLEYTITAANSVATAQWNNIILEDTLSEDLNYLAGTGKVYVDGNLVNQADINFNQATNKLTVTTGKSISGVGNVVVKFDAIVKSSAMNKVVGNVATLNGTSAESNGTKVYSVTTNNVENPGGVVQSSGALELLSVPDVNFGEQTVSVTNIGKPFSATYSKDLVVNDNRAHAKSDWYVTVKQSTPLTSSDNLTVLKDSLSFRKAKGSSLTSLGDGSAQTVHEHTPQINLGQLEVVKPTTSWNKAIDDTGFYLILNEHVKKGDYSAVLTWTLNDVPTN